MAIIHEFDNRGSHRLIDSDHDQVGEWASYKLIARLKSKGKEYLAVSDFFEHDGAVYEVKKIKAQSISLRGIRPDHDK